MRRRVLATVMTCAAVGVAWMGLPVAQAGEACTITGTAGADDLEGTNGPDVICGKGGRDTIVGRRGDDVILGGPGNDVIDGGRGDDSLLGGHGSDGMSGGRGVDAFSGGKGFDCFGTRDGNSEIVRGGWGRDTGHTDASDLLRSVEIESPACRVAPVA
jgi:Ca2+-binding RTX toxin-like protein